MEVPGIAPGSAKPSPLVSTCVFEDLVSPAAGLLDGPPSASHSRLSPSRPRSQWPAAKASPNYRRSPYRLGQAARGTGCVSYAAKAKLSLAVVFFPGVSRGSGKPRHATSGSENASNLFHPLVINQQQHTAREGCRSSPRHYQTLIQLPGSVNPLARRGRRPLPLTAFRYNEYTACSRSFTYYRAAATRVRRPGDDRDATARFLHPRGGQP